MSAHPTRSISLPVSLLAFSMAGVCACSLEPAPARGGALRISLVPDPIPVRDQQLFASLSSGPSSSTSTPTATSINDFACFLVNIAGPGIYPRPIPDGCSSGDNLNNHGLGVYSQPFGIDSPVELEVPSGMDRAIDVFGVIGISPACPNWTDVRATISGYFLGGTTASVFSDTAVTIPIRFDPARRSFICGAQPDTTTTTPPSTTTPTTTVPTRTLIPDGTTLNGKIFYENTATRCTTISFSSGALTNTGAPPSGAVLNEIPAAGYTHVSSREGNCTTLSNCAITECNYYYSLGTTYDTEVMYVVWNLAGIDASVYRGFKVKWYGVAGYTSASGACANDPLAGSNSSGNANSLTLQLYHPPDMSWPTLGLITPSYAPLASEETLYSPISRYLDGSSQIAVRIVSTPAVSGQCSAVQTDHIRLELTP